MAARCSSVVACSEMARFGINGSVASRSSIGTRPTVERVTRRGGKASPSGSFTSAQRLHRGVVVVQRLAHAHQHDVERRVEQSGRRASTRTCAAISPAVRFRTRPILPVRQKAQPIAQPTCVETQKVWAGVSGM